MTVLPALLRCNPSAIRYISANNCPTVPFQSGSSLARSHAIDADFQTQSDVSRRSQKQNIEGTVLIAMEIGTDGAVCDLALISGHPLLAPAAIDAVRQWKYRPYLLNGTPVEIETQAQMNFVLTSK